jgi:ubiquinone/menaquinone biosynthesis C-methylase UbiE
MPPFRVSQEDAEKSYVSYMLEAPPFKPFELSEGEKKRIAERYASLLQTQNGEGIDIANLDDKVERLLVGVPKGSRVLLLGVGVGYETKAAKEAGYAATGITLGSRNIDFGRRILHLTPEEHIECSVDVLPFPKETFDAVIGFQIFEHVIAPLLFLLEQSRVLKFGGKLI